MDEDKNEEMDRLDDSQKDIKQEEKTLQKEEKEIAREEKELAKEEGILQKAALWQVISVILAIAVIFLFVNKLAGGAPGTCSADGEIADQFLYLKSTSCGTLCDEMEPKAKAVAEKAGLDFRQVRYPQPAQIPGYVLINNGELTIAGIEDEAGLAEQLCAATENKAICADADIAKANAQASLGEKTPKEDKPTFQIFYMSYCPYGIQAVEGFAEAAKLFGDKINYEPHFVVYGDYCAGGRCKTEDYCIDGNNLCSMHGVAELNEDIRQACIWKGQKDKYWDYTLCAMGECSVGNIETCWETCADKTKVDKEKVKACQKDEGVALMTAEKALNTELEVQGSPTMFLNGENYAGARTADAYKEQLCCGFTAAPAECGTKLSSDAAAASGECG